MDSNKISDTITKLIEYVKKELAVEIEKSISKYSQEYAETNDTIYLLESIYDTKLEEILIALANNSDIVKTKEDASKIAFLRPDELNADKYQDLLKKKEIREFKKNNVKASNAFKCSKCKKSKCQVTQKQIRAGDEPATTFVTCLECGHTFSFNT
jgi:DNA-directed RNA polymerase subunit M/transcription elongation factor TFIIS